MTISEQEVAEAVGFAVRFPSLRRKVLPETMDELVDEIRERVKATEKPSAITKGSAIDTGLRRKIVARVLTQASIRAEVFGGEADAKRASGSRNSKPLAH